MSLATLSFALYIAGCIAWMSMHVVSHRFYFSENSMTPFYASTRLDHSYISSVAKYLESSDDKDWVGLKEVLSKLPDVQWQQTSLQGNRSAISVLSKSKRGEGTSAVVLSTELPIRSQAGHSFLPCGLLVDLLRSVYQGTWAARDTVFVWLPFHSSQQDLATVLQSLQLGADIWAGLHIQYSDPILQKGSSLTPPQPGLEVRVTGDDGRQANLDFVFLATAGAGQTNLRNIPVRMEQSFEGENLVKAILGNKAAHAMRITMAQARGEASGVHGAVMNLQGEGISLHLHARESPSLMRGLSQLVESLVRSCNTIEERFHQSYFYYSMPSPFEYNSISEFLPCVVVVCAPLIFLVLEGAFINRVDVLCPAMLMSLGPGLVAASILVVFGPIASLASIFGVYFIWPQVFNTNRLEALGMGNLKAGQAARTGSVASVLALLLGIGISNAGMSFLLSAFGVPLWAASLHLASSCRRGTLLQLNHLFSLLLLAAAPLTIRLVLAIPHDQSCWDSISSPVLMSAVCSCILFGACLCSMSK